VRSRELYPLGLRAPRFWLRRRSLRQPDVFDLTVSGTDQSQNEMCPEASRDFVPQNVVYLICIRAENSEDVNLLQPYPPILCRRISDLYSPQLSHRLTPRRTGGRRQHRARSPKNRRKGYKEQ